MDLRPSSVATPIPAAAGVGLRYPHHRFVADNCPPVAWYEVHPENYMTPGPARRDLERIRLDRPISFHAVGLSLGSWRPPDSTHLARLRGLADRIEPGLVSDHLSWSMAETVGFADLLPLPYTEEALTIVARNIDQAQTALGRRILVENPSAYLAYSHSTIAEADFLAELARRTGCGILCDLNNLVVSAHNLRDDAERALRALPAWAVEEMHVAGHARVRSDDQEEICIDDHGSPVGEAVWSLLDMAIRRFGAKPVLMEWDTDIPPFDVLAAEASRAQERLDRAPTGGERNARAA